MLEDVQALDVLKLGVGRRVAEGASVVAEPSNTAVACMPYRRGDPKLWLTATSKTYCSPGRYSTTSSPELGSSTAIATDAPKLPPPWQALQVELDPGDPVRFWFCAWATPELLDERVMLPAIPTATRANVQYVRVMS